MNKKYIVKVDDMFHYMDESERYEDGTYSSLEEAIKRCEEITIRSLKDLYTEGVEAGKLAVLWGMFGEDPFIVGDIDIVAFSAMKYVSEDLCAKIIKEIESTK